MNPNRIFFLLILSFFANSLHAQWSLTGNAILSNQFLGTTNNQSLIFKQNNQEIFTSFGNSLILGKIVNPYFQDNTFVFGYAIGNDDSGESNGFAIGKNLKIGYVNTFTLGFGLSPEVPLENTLENSLMIGFNSNIPSFFIGPSAGLNTTGNVGIATTNPIEKFEVNGAIRLGTTSTTNNGTLRFTGTDFEGYVGGQWRSLTATTSGGAGTWTLSGTNLYSANSGNTGIGTTSPLTKLHITGNMTLDDVSPTIYTGIGNTDQNRYLTIISSPNATFASGLKAGGLLVADAYNYANPAKNNLIVKGNVGIGTPAPENAEGWSNVLNVNGSTNAKIITTTSNGLYVGTWAHSSGYFSAPAGGMTGTYSNHPFSVITNKISRLTIATNGDVSINEKLFVTGNTGIGLTTPTAKLEVKGSMVVGNGQNGQRWIFDSRYYANGDYLLIAGDKADGTYDLDKTLSIERATGKVSIGGGLTTPGTYRLFVKGGILTEKVKVAVANTTNWADYVFAPEYCLRPLSEVEVFIKKNKHLPEVPSADEVVKEGIDIAEMDALLLKKIEELTLYMIEQNKRIEKLEKENTALKQRTN